MKRLAHPCGVLTALLIAVSCLIIPPMAAQTILIDSTFTTDGEIFPFQSNDTIYGLSISGSVSLSSDTSLVRVILTDDAGHEWMVYEAYPLILPGKLCTLHGIADETVYLQVIHPSSIKIQIINGMFVLSALDLRTQYSENLESSQMTFKESLETRKVDSMNYFIENNQMIWFADKSPISVLSFSEKRDLYGEKFNLKGLDYYVGGLYDATPGVNGPIDNSQLINSWDWRNRHGANDPNKTTFYYDNDINGTGWMTKVQNQNLFSCDGLCYIYAPLGAVEGVANLYFNDHIDYNLSVQQVLDCDSDHSVDQCEIGDDQTTHSYIALTGVVDSNIYPRGDYPSSCYLSSIPANQKQYQISNPGTPSVNNLNPDNIKNAIITRGPLICLLEGYTGNINHYMSIIGYKVISAGNVFYKNS